MKNHGEDNSYLHTILGALQLINVLEYKKGKSK